jgi:hypothetical protein
MLHIYLYIEGLPNWLAHRRAWGLFLFCLYRFPENVFCDILLKSGWSRIFFEKYQFMKNHGWEITERKLWNNHGTTTMEKQSWITRGGIMQEQVQSLSTIHGRAIIDGKSWRGNHGWLHARSGNRTAGWSERRLDGRTDGLTDWWTDGWTEGRTVGRSDGWTAGPTDGRRSDGRTVSQTAQSYNICQK